MGGGGEVVLFFLAGIITLCLISELKIDSQHCGGNLEAKKVQGNINPVSRSRNTWNGCLIISEAMTRNLEVSGASWGNLARGFGSCQSQRDPAPALQAGCPLSPSLMSDGTSGMSSPLWVSSSSVSWGELYFVFRATVTAH